MKKLLASLMCIVSFSSCDAQDQLTMNITDLKSDTVRVFLVDKSFRGYEKRDTVIAKNGTFTYNVDDNEARLVQFVLKGAKGPSQLEAYTVPGQKGVLTGTTEHAVWSGDKFFQDLARFNAVTEPFHNKISDISEDYEKQVMAGANNDSLKKAIMPIYNDVVKQMRGAMSDFIKNNPSSDVCATILSDMNPEESEKVLPLISDNVKTGAFSHFIKTAESKIAADKAQKEAAKKVADGMPAPDFTLNDINGKPLSLSGLRGKYVVLDFWGSWCGWCIKGFPEMKEYYKKYAGKFEILGIDCRDTEEKWKKAVKDNELPWLHVYNPRTSTLCNDYAITGYPTKIIIDPEGKIAKTVVGESPEFYEFLDEKFGK